MGGRVLIAQQIRAAPARLGGHAVLTYGALVGDPPERAQDGYELAQRACMNSFSILSPLQ
jgi:hypothetical protein